MPGFATNDLVGMQPLTSIWNLDTVYPGGNFAQPFLQPGLILAAADQYWGSIECLYVKFGGTVRQYGLCVVTPTFSATAGTGTGFQAPGYEYLATEAPASPNLGRTLGVALRNATANQYGWLIVGGVTPVNCNASVAAGTTFGIAAAGQGGANVASRQVVNAVVVQAAAATVVKGGCFAPNASTVLNVPNVEGWFPGIYLSGTGIAAGTVVTGIDVDNRRVILNNATTAAVNGNVTGTYNNGTVFYNVAHLNRPFAQGAIT